MTPWVPGFDMANVSISDADIRNGSPRAGDMIARNPKDHNDKWLVAKQYFEDNLELAVTASGNTRTNLSFGAAINALKSGNKVARKGWNDKGMYLILAEEGSFYKVGQETGAEVGTEPFIVMFTAQQLFQPGWLASQADILAEDWTLVP